MAAILVAQDGDLIMLPWGWARLANNEFHLVSTVADPPLIVQGSVAGISLGGMAFGRLRNDGSGKIDQMVLFQGKQDERTRHDPTRFAGEFTVHLSDGLIHRNPDGSANNDQSLQKVIEGRHDGVWIKGLSPGEGLPPGPAPNDPPVVPPPPPPPPPPVGEYPPGTAHIAEGDFAALRLVYDVDLEDEEGDYHAGRMPWVGPRTGFSVLWMAFRKAIPTVSDPNDS